MKTIKSIYYSIESNINFKALGRVLLFALALILVSLAWDTGRSDNLSLAILFALFTFVNILISPNK